MVSLIKYRNLEDAAADFLSFYRLEEDLSGSYDQSRRPPKVDRGRQ